MSFKPTDSSLFFSRNDATDPRLGELALRLPATASADQFKSTLLNSQRPGVRSFVLAGYPDDEGIRINGGRPGAAHAPDSVRKPFYKMTPQLLHTRHEFQIYDLGNLATEEFDIATRHRRAQDFALAALSTGASWLSIGGGHDYGFPDAAAFIEWAKASGHARPLVINFDAHLDVRSLQKGLSSGTPFYRMLETYPDVDFAEIGIQGQCNSRTHLEWVKSRGARVLTHEEFETSNESFSTMVLRTLDDWILKSRPVFLSIDIDGFSSSFAPGCSQSWSTGMTPIDFFPLLTILTRRLDVKALGIYEVSPPLDHDDRTAKLAAQILHRTLEPL